MQASETPYLLALLKVSGVGPVAAKNLIAWCGGAEAVFRTPKGLLMQVPGIGPKTAEQLLAAEPLKLAEEELSFLEKEGASVRIWLNEDYPEVLKTIPQAPLLLYHKGPLDLNAQQGIAIVGTRKATAYGKKYAQELAQYFAHKGFNIVSGLAYGIDAEAHRAVVQAGGRTTAVLAHGLDRIYPNQHYNLAQEILATGGCWVSEYPTGTKPDGPNFPQRNRIIAGLARATIVVEAAEKGGALITAKLAFDDNREVYALPGPVDAPYSAGCNRLIRDSIAKLLTSPEEILEDLGWLEEANRPAAGPDGYRKVRVPLTNQEQLVLDLLTKQGHHLDALAERADLPIGELTSILLALEFKELVQQMPGRMFIRL